MRVRALGEVADKVILTPDQAEVWPKALIELGVFHGFWWLVTSRRQKPGKTRAGKLGGAAVWVSPVRWTPNHTRTAPTRLPDIQEICVLWPSSWISGNNIGPNSQKPRRISSHNALEQRFPGYPAKYQKE